MSKINILDRLTVVELKNLLRKKGLSITGKKIELIKRLQMSSGGAEFDLDALFFEKNKKADKEGNVIEEDLEELQAGDSASQVMSVARSGMSRVSNVSERRAAAAIEKISLLARVKRLKELEELELQQVALKQRKERLELQSKLEEVEATEQELCKLEGSKVSKISRGSRIGKVNIVENEIKSICSNIGENAGIYNLPESKSENNLMRELINYNIKSLMPSQELNIFKGDVTEYISFIHIFDEVIASKPLSEREKLHYLFQYTEGKAKDLVKPCLLMDSKDGYKSARSLLNRRYGNPEQVCTAYIDKLLQWQKIDISKPETLDEFSIMINSCKNAVSSVPYGTSELNNPKTMRTILEKLPYELQNNWRRTNDELQRKMHRKSNFEDLAVFIEDEARMINNPVYGSKFFKDTNDKNKPKNEDSKVRKNDKGFERVPCYFTRRELKCYYCEEPHIISNCTKLGQLQYEERLDVVRSLELCFRCLKYGHWSRICKSEFGCEICQGNHHKLMHRETPRTNFVTPDYDANEENLAVFTVANKRCGSMSVVPVVVKYRGNKYQTLAFLDSGSALTFCSKRLTEKLRVEPTSMKSTQLPVTTINGFSKLNCNIVAGLEVSDLHRVNSIELPPVYAISKIPVEKCDAFDYAKINQWPHLKDIELPDLSGEIDLLIGSNVPQALEPRNVVVAPNEYEPFAVCTRLGWVVCGLVDGVPSSFAVNNISLKDKEEHLRLIEAYNSDFKDLHCFNSERSYEDAVWLEKVTKGIRKVGDQYEIPLLFKDENLILPYTKGVALRRLNILKNKLKKDSEMREQYGKFMNNMIEQGYCEKVPAVEADKTSRTWFIPHFGVRHPDKPGKTRVVFDCAAKVSSLSFNDLLIQGPNINNLLVDVLLRFRIGKYSYTGDIETMFYQVLVPQCQRDMLRFFWYENDNLDGKILQYRMRTHLFGACSSPSVANFALKQTALDNKHLFSVDVSNTVIDNFYVDDCLKSSNCVNDLIKNASEVKQLCKKGGFNFTKIVSPTVEVLKSFPNDLGVKLSDINSEISVVKVLGLLWSISSDTLGVELSVSKDIVSKRTLLAAVGSIYDPLGILSPVVLQGRLILQEISRLKLNWDEKLSAELNKLVNVWLDEVKQYKMLKISRCFKSNSFGNIQELEMHIFSDASSNGYAAVCYFLLSDDCNQKCISFVLGKSRVGPLKTVSIPRLELTAAALSVKLKSLVVSALKLEPVVFYWTDSTTVLKYIFNETLKLQTFVANRVAIIRDHSKKEQWRYVSSSLNPADDGSRASQTERWIVGPKFLLDRGKWPKLPELNYFDGSDLEIKKDVKVNVVISNNKMSDLISSCSSWIKLIRLIGWLVKFKSYLIFKKLNKNVSLLTYLTINDLREAEISIIKYIQGEFYGEEIKTLNKGEYINKKSSLYTLKPVVISNILRVGGRLKNSYYSMNVKHPIIVPNKSHISMLIILYYHYRVGHLGVNAVLSALREKFWIVSGYATVRKYVSSCIKCKKYKGHVVTQQMANLPISRTESDVNPFHYVGLDCFGPFTVKRGRSNVKRWGLLFTCLTIRAVHLEVVIDMTTDAFINALRRFIARRGNVRTIKCDNGTNFIGAKNELDKINNKVVINELSNKGIVWELNPPGASHFGGVWERMIRTVRQILNFTAEGQSLTDDTLYTLFCEVEMIINNRPLTAVGQDINDLVPITPSLLLNVDTSHLEDSFGENGSYCRRRWRQIQFLADQFWKRWRVEYLVNLQSRQKWIKRKRDVQVNDIVLIIDEQLPRGHWPLARVVDISISSDGLVRSVKLFTKGKVVTRPISKLILILECEKGLIK